MNKIVNKHPKLWKTLKIIGFYLICYIVAELIILLALLLKQHLANVSWETIWHIYSQMQIAMPLLAFVYSIIFGIPILALKGE